MGQPCAYAIYMPADCNAIQGHYVIRIPNYVNRETVNRESKQRFRGHVPCAYTLTAVVAASAVTNDAERPTERRRAPLSLSL